MLIIKPEFLFSNDESLAMQYQEYPIRFKGIFVMISTALLQAVVVIMMRKLGSKCHTMTISQYNGIYGMMFAPFFMFFQGVKSIGVKEMLGLVALGVFGWLGQVSATRSMLFEKAGKVSVIRYSQILVTLLIDYFILGFTPDAYSLFGSLMIPSSVFSLVFDNSKKK